MIKSLKTITNIVDRMQQDVDLLSQLKHPMVDQYCISAALNLIVLAEQALSMMSKITDEKIEEIKNERRNSTGIH